MGSSNRMILKRLTLRIIAGMTALVIAGAQLATAQLTASAVDGTDGVPLGGIGSGGIKFCAHSGVFAGTWRAPCALDNFKLLPNTQFQLFTKNNGSVATKDKLSAVIASARASDDGVYPVHFAYLGNTNSVLCSLTAFSPINFSNVDQMCYPYAFYQIKVTNTSAVSVDVAVAFQANISGTVVPVDGKGIKNDDGIFKRAVYATSDDQAAVISTGTASDNGFLTNGVCNTAVAGATNKVAVKVTLAAGQSKLIKFVYSWYNNVNGKEGNYGMFYYLTYFSNAGAVADTGLSHFDQFRDNAVSIVTRMRASNFPDWIKNQALVTLSNLTNNTMYRQDGRFCYTEGQWATNGTMDQMWHARQIVAQTIPSLVWKELHYWARTQKTDPVGQIHHDMDNGTARDMDWLSLWDDKQHRDYRDIDKWVDLNCAFIISIYEGFIATDDHVQLDSLWPYAKLAAQRILTQVTEMASVSYPYTFENSENSYDAGGDPNAYNASITLPTYKILSILCEIKGETALKKTFDDAFTKASDSFKKRYLTGNFPKERICESVMSGQWLAYELKMGDLFDTTSIAYALTNLNSYYKPLTIGLGQWGYNEWAPYIVSHYAGLCLYTGRQAIWKALQKDWYDLIFNNRELVYNQELGIPNRVPPIYISNITRTDQWYGAFSGYLHYLSVPVVWRNYYALVGFHRNQHTQELWLEPIIPDTMNHVMKNAVVFTPEGWATINCSETGSNYLKQSIIFTPDKPVAVSKIYLKDKGSANVYVWINEIAHTDFTRIGTGYQKELKVNWNQTVPASGIKIYVSDVNTPQSVIPRGFSRNSRIPGFSNTAKSFSVTTCNSGSHEISIFGISGKMLRRFNGEGSATYTFGTSAHAQSFQLNAGVYMVRVKSGDNVHNRNFIVSR